MIHTRKISITIVQNGLQKKKPKSFKLTKCFNQKIKPKMFNGIFNNQEAKLNFHQVKNKKKHKELKKIVKSIK